MLQVQQNTVRLPTYTYAIENVVRATSFHCYPGLLDKPVQEKPCLR